MAQNRPGSWTPNPFGHSPITEYIEPGDSPQKLHMRTNLPSADYVGIIARCVKRYTRTFNFSGLEMIKDMESLFPSVGGERIKEVTDMLTGRDSEHKNPKNSHMMGDQVVPYRTENTENR